MLRESRGVAENPGWGVAEVLVPSRQNLDKRQDDARPAQRSSKYAGTRGEDDLTRYSFWLYRVDNRLDDHLP